MSELHKLREFVYKVNGQYFVLGKNVNKKCDTDTKLISLYKEYEELTNNELFTEYSPINMDEKHRQKVGMKYKEIVSKCNKDYCKQMSSDEKRYSFDSLENSDDAEQISKQIDTWKKALECWQRSCNEGEFI